MTVATTSRARWLVGCLLIAAGALFAIGASVERNNDVHLDETTVTATIGEGPAPAEGSEAAEAAEDAGNEELPTATARPANPPTRRCWASTSNRHRSCSRSSSRDLGHRRTRHVERPRAAAQRLLQGRAACVSSGRKGAQDREQGDAISSVGREQSVRPAVPVGETVDPSVQAGIHLSWLPKSW